MTDVYNAGFAMDAPASISQSVTWTGFSSLSLEEMVKAHEIDLALSRDSKTFVETIRRFVDRYTEIQ